MKILIFLKYLAGGGAERVMINIMNHLDKKQYDIVLVVGNNMVNDYPDFMDKNVKIVGYQSKRARDSLLKLRKTIIREKPDLIFTTTSAANIMVSLANAAALWRRAPLVIREANYRSEAKDATKLNKLMVWITYNLLSDTVVAVSDEMKEGLVEKFHIRSGKIKTIYNLVDIERIDQLKTENQNVLLMDDSRKSIVAVGRLVEQKDYPTLLMAFQIVAASCPAKLIILGKGPLEKELRKLSVDLGVDHLVEFIGFVSNPYQYLHHADVCVLTSKFEGFPNVIAEALACGVPVVSTDCKSGPREILKDGLYGRLAPVGDYKQIAENIIDVLRNDNEKVVAAGLERARDFEAGKKVAEYETLFQELFHKRNG